jgi:lambda repressor-like predicted transcriptional regulator
MSAQGSRTPPDEKMRRRIRAGLILRGTSIATWCRENGADDDNLHKVLNGKWRGAKAAMLLARIERAAGL